MDGQPVLVDTTLDMKMIGWPTLAQSQNRAVGPGQQRLGGGLPTVDRQQQSRFAHRREREATKRSVIAVGLVMAVPTTTNEAPRSSASLASSRDQIRPSA